MSACIALFSRWSVEIKKVFTPKHWIIIPGNEILNNGKVRKFHTPSTPFTDLLDSPPEMDRKPLASSSMEGVSTIAIWINVNIQEIVLEHFKECLGCLLVVLVQQDFFINAKHLPLAHYHRLHDQTCLSCGKHTHPQFE